MNPKFTRKIKEKVKIEFWKEQDTLKITSDEEFDRSKNSKGSWLTSKYPNVCVSKDFMNYLNINISSLKYPGRDVKNFTNKTIITEMIKYLSQIEESSGKSTNKIS